MTPPPSKKSLPAGSWRCAVVTQKVAVRVALAVAVLVKAAAEILAILIAEP